ncbi:hypothetical protein PGT21_009223 [Puccinia graminis f. sp. tritici]|uniref:RING-type domain-containing protein n=1 Tax=Puccinia graminis f. sp. tritici TaxID=56615 RepID=A0A5B0MU95_PUCGR|nr:hypothetical protein PGT21_009223 [Puccinia graminis f. sp. tritici]
MYLTINTILILVFYASSSTSAQLTKRSHFEEEVAADYDIGRAYEDSELADRASEAAHQNCEVVAVQAAPQMRTYPRREVDWDKFQRIIYSPTASSFKTVDMTKNPGQVSPKEKLNRNETWYRRRLKAIQDSTIKPFTRSIERIKGLLSKKVHLKSDLDSCRICFEEYKYDEPGTLLLVFPGCGDVFHESCLTRWLDESPCIESLFRHTLACPTCRRQAPTKHRLRFLGALTSYHRNGILLIKLHIALFILVFFLMREAIIRNSNQY